MFVYYILLIIFLFSLCRNYKKTLLIYLPIRIALHQGIILYPANPTVMFDSVACFFIILYYFFVGRKNKEYKFPFWFPFLLFGFSEFCSSFLAHTDGNAMNFLQNIVVTFLFVYVLWNYITNKSDLKFIIKGYSIIFSIAICLSVFEQITHFNPVIFLEKALLPANAPYGLIWESSQVRFGGLFRAQSFMSISITYGGYCLMFFLFYYFMSSRYPQYNYFKKYKNKLFLFGLAIGTFICGSKAPILSLIVGFLPYFRLKWMYNIKLIIAILIIVPLTFSLAEKIYDDIYDSLTVENAYEYTGGSSLAMREVQLEISLREFSKSPIIGNGTKYLAETKKQASEILGAESIWFILLIEKGLIGIIAFLVLVFYPITVKKTGNPRPYWALAIAWIFLNTMSTIPGLNNTFYYTLIILLYKAELFERETKNMILKCQS